MVCQSSLIRVAFAAALACLSPAQDDMRDKLTLTNGKVVNGRIVSPYKSGELLIVQGGKRVRIEASKIAKKELVADSMVEFFKRRDQYGKSRRALRYLVDWAETHDLKNMARLQATELVLQDDTDTAMHEFLGHRLRSGKWLWPHNGKQITLEKLQAALTKRPLKFAGERFTLSCDAALLTNLHALFDLERLGITWFKEFGEDLGLKEVLTPIAIRTYRNSTEFPKWGFRPRPFFEPPPHDNLGRTFYSGALPTRPQDLFFLGTQGLLYRTLIGEGDQFDNRGRICAWLEIGLGMHMEKVMQGPAGFAAPGKPKKLDLLAMRALGRGYRLTHLVHLPMYGSFYMTDSTTTQINWSAASMFTTWLLDDTKIIDTTRTQFLQYIRAALADRQGDSSTTFDRIMGKPVEQFDEPWRAWLNNLAGY